MTKYWNYVRIDLLLPLILIQEVIDGVRPLSNRKREDTSTATICRVTDDGYENHCCWCVCIRVYTICYTFSAFLLIKCINEDLLKTMSSTTWKSFVKVLLLSFDWVSFALSRQILMTFRNSDEQRWYAIRSLERPQFCAYCELVEYINQTLNQSAIYRIWTL